MALTPFIGGGLGMSMWDPWDRSVSDHWVPISRILDLVDFEPATPVSSFSKNTMAVANTRVDWKETPEAHIFIADLPGVRKEDMKIELVDNKTLRISGERHKEQEEKTDKWHRVERSSGRFMRQFRLPENINVEGMCAKLENGVLTVKVPKTQPDVGGSGEAKKIDIGGTEDGGIAGA